ncbi:protein lin-7 homolog A isoform X2 [Lontra canadensis]|uniref:protein lin-7 homolog A isoform X2 n=1 Tax=Lontra canadensis TaxID=76717 RepID=UPI0013F30A00|nr:protein lin-7 homolog A isoform X2 [Lontra canadensis]
MLRSPGPGMPSPGSGAPAATPSPSPGRLRAAGFVGAEAQRPMLPEQLNYWKNYRNLEKYQCTSYNPSKKCFRVSFVLLFERCINTCMKRSLLMAVLNSVPGPQQRAWKGSTTRKRWSCSRLLKTASSWWSATPPKSWKKWRRASRSSARPGAGSSSSCSFSSSNSSSSSKHSRTTCPRSLKRSYLIEDLIVTNSKPGFRIPAHSKRKRPH